MEDKIRIKKTTLWQASTVILGVLLIISILTNGFSSVLKPTTNKTASSADATITTPSGLVVIELNDKRCSECDISGIIGQLKQLLPGLEVMSVDYSSEQGKALYNDLHLGNLPVLLFTEEVKEQEGYANIQNYLEEKGDYLSLRIGAKFDPTKEVCDNKIDDDGNGKIDCEDPYCSPQFICREEIPKKLDVFVMSQCPFGTKALDAMKEILETFKDIDFNIYYIANENPDGSFNALHGQPEVDENIRELCAIEHYPENYKYMDYIWCRNKNIRDSNWEPCAVQAFGTADTIKTCFEGDEGKQLLSENIKTANALGIGASPTWLANNKHKFGGIDAETVKTEFCKVNPGLEGCEKTLSSDAGTPAGSC